MSLDAYVWAMSQDLPAVQKATLMVLAEQHRNSYGVKPFESTYGHLETYAGLSRSAVLKAIKGLAKVGVVVVQKRKITDTHNLPNLYTLQFDRPGPLKVEWPKDYPFARNQGGAPKTLPPQESPSSENPVGSQAEPCGSSAPETPPLVCEAHQGSTPKTLPLVRQKHQGSVSGTPSYQVQEYQESQESGKYKAPSAQRASALVVSDDDIEEVLGTKPPKAQPRMLMSGAA